MSNTILEMEEPIYRCPCCNKLVRADHFRRAPMTKEDIIALSLHPQMERRIVQLIDQVLAKSDPPTKKRHTMNNEAPRGFLRYKDACREFNISYGTLRTYITRGLIQGGDGFVRVTSLMKFSKNYKPRHHQHK